MLKYITVVYPDEITVAFKANKTQALSDESISFTDMSVGFPSTWLLGIYSCRRPYRHLNGTESEFSI